MLVGGAGADGTFVPDGKMLFNMYRLVDIGDAEATYPDDVDMILDGMVSAEAEPPLSYTSPHAATR
jgi:hypothetical protein